MPHRRTWHDQAVPKCYLVCVRALGQVEPVSKEQDEALRKWTDKTPAMAAAKGTGKPPGTAGSSKEGKKKGKKK